ncbi:hypothetical protein ABW19_dt0209789 [Dactylella cylindrospora]|nr:hypothetical protein ABW19_dt0209789 [Dactylella cylindrospora]
MHSFTQIAAAIAIAASTVSALSIGINSSGEPKIEARDVNVCWGKNSNGTDATNQPTPGRCLNSHWEDAFTAPFVLIPDTLEAASINTEKHQTFGPWHCCASCKAEDNCIGWQINTNCDCVLWKFTPVASGSAVLGVYGGPFQNQSGTFHRGPAFPAKPNKFGNTLIN